jgi:hypothetical protein
VAQQKRRTTQLLRRAQLQNLKLSHAHRSGMLLQDAAMGVRGAIAKVLAYDNHTNAVHALMGRDPTAAEGRRFWAMYFGQGDRSYVV